MPTYSAVISGDSRFTAYLDVTESGINNDANTSVVNYTLRLVSASAIRTYSSTSVPRYSLTINGVVIATNVIYAYDFPAGGGTKTIATGSLTVAHNGDGSKSVVCSGYVLMDDGKGSASPSGTFVLTVIPRGMVYIGNASGTPVRGQVYIGNASGTPVQAKEVWIGNASGTPVRSL